jgi:hypothetical protein
VRCRGVQRRLTMAEKTGAGRSSDLRHAARCLRCSDYVRRDAELVRLLAQQRAPAQDPDFEIRLLRRLNRTISAEKKPPVRAVPGMAAGLSWQPIAAAAGLLILAAAGVGSYRRAFRPLPAGRPQVPAIAVEESGAPTLPADREVVPLIPDESRVLAAAPTNAPPDRVDEGAPRPQLIRYDP